MRERKAKGNGRKEGKGTEEKQRREGSDQNEGRNQNPQTKWVCAADLLLLHLGMNSTLSSRNIRGTKLPAIACW